MNSQLVTAVAGVAAAAGQALATAPRAPVSAVAPPRHIPSPSPSPQAALGGAAAAVRPLLPPSIVGGPRRPDDFAGGMPLAQPVPGGSAAALAHALGGGMQSAVVSALTAAAAAAAAGGGSGSGSGGGSGSYGLPPSSVSSSSSASAGAGSAAAAAAAAVAAAASATTALSPFLKSLLDMLADGSLREHIHWSDDGGCVVVHNHPAFTSEVLPRFFKHNNFSSFVRGRSSKPRRWPFVPWDPGIVCPHVANRRT